MRVKQVTFGFVLAAIIMSQGAAQAATCGAAYFSDEITWSWNSPLYYSVAGAPANTCGDLWAWRNGSGYNMEAAGWICTDGSGNATKGPWYWSNQTQDELAFAYIDWGSCTSPERRHIWDISPPTAAVTSSCPSAFSGTASDPGYGAGFNSNWASCTAEFYNSTTGKWWNPTSGLYDNGGPFLVPCTCNNMPGANITWSCSSIPGSHVAGQSYIWYISVYDGGQFNAYHSAYCSF